MKSHLAQAFPHIHTNAFDKNLSQTNASIVDTLFDSDLVMLLTADWASSSWTNRAWLQANRPTPLIISWLEAHALASHTVQLPRIATGGCIACGHDGCGRPKLPALQFSENPLLKVPACGGTFIPYGAMALSKAAGLVAEQAVSVLLHGFDPENHLIR